MMTQEQYLLTKLAEECNEVAQMALKCQHFGLYEQQPGNLQNNVERLKGELNDLLGVVELMNRKVNFEFTPSSAFIDTKIQKVEYYAKYSQSLGLVEWEED